MNQRIDAIYENGVFRPESPVNFPDGERVRLNVESQDSPPHDLSDIEDLLDVEFIESCRQPAAETPSLDETRDLLSAFHGSLADRIIEDRDER